MHYQRLPWSHSTFNPGPSPKGRHHDVIGIACWLDKNLAQEGQQDYCWIAIISLFLHLTNEQSHKWEVIKRNEIRALAKMIYWSMVLGRPPHCRQVWQLIGFCWAEKKRGYRDWVFLRWKWRGACFSVVFLSYGWFLVASTPIGQCGEGEKRYGTESGIVHRFHTQIGLAERTKVV
jgi:hypothetical protein